MSQPPPLPPRRSPGLPVRGLPPPPRFSKPSLGETERRRSPSRCDRLRSPSRSPKPRILKTSPIPLETNRSIKPELALPCHRPAAPIFSKEETNIRLKLAEELVTTEKTYVQGLKAISKGFVHRLRALHQLHRAVLEPNEIEIAFSRIPEIYDLNTSLYRDLKHLMCRGQLETIELPRVLTRYTPFFKLYSSFVSDHEDSIKSIAAFRASKPAFDQFMELSEKCEGKLIQDLMILPVQRIPRYVMFLQRLVKLCKPDDPALPGLEEARKQISAVAELIERRVGQQIARQRVLSIQQSFETAKDFQLVTPTRLLIKEGMLRKRYNNVKMRLSLYKTYCFFLFNDSLLYTTKPSTGGARSPKHLLALDGMEVTDVIDGSLYGVEETNMFQISQRKAKTFLVVADSAEGKAQWLRSLRETMDQLSVNKNSFLTSSRSTLKIEPLR